MSSGTPPSGGTQPGGPPATPSSASTGAGGVTTPASTTTVPPAAPPPTVVAPPPTVPKNPIMGGLVKIKEEFVAWTGGMPNTYWTGLHSSSASSHTNPNQLRPTGVSSQQKSYRACCEPVEVKFKRGDSIKQFEKNILRKLEASGLDSTTYVPDPQDPSKMICAVTEYGRLSKEHIVAHLKKVMTRWDVYDKENDGAGRTMVRNSLDDSFSEDVKALLPPNDKANPEENTLLFFWFRAMEEAQTLSIQHYDNVKERVIKRKATDYPGENLDLLAKDYIKDTKELDQGGAYDHSLTLKMLEAFVIAGGNGHKVDTFRQQLHKEIAKVKAALEKIQYMGSIADKNEYMRKGELLPLTMCQFAAKKYRTLVGANDWPPASSVTGKARVPSSFGNLASVIGQSGGDNLVCLTQAGLNTLIQNSVGGNSGGNGGTGGGQSGGRDKSNDTCNNCGQKGHWSRECPQHKSKNQSNSNGGKNGGRGDNRGTNGGGKPKSSNQNPKYKKLAPGERTFRNGSWYEYCLKCKRQTCTHNTETHTGKVNNGNSNPQASLALIQDPSAWNVDLVSPFGFDDVASLFG